MLSPFEFLEGLRDNNNREWFALHKPEYEAIRQSWIADIQRLIDIMAAEFDPSLAHVDAKDCLYRIYRDIRFSPDKTPYKTYFSALLSPGGRHWDKAAYYIHCGVDECALYGGVWCPPPPMLRKLRAAIVDNIDEFREIISDPELERLYPGWFGRKLKTTPKGYDRNHPEAELLRLTEYGKAHALTRSFFENPGWPEKAAGIFRVLKPLMEFLNYSIDE